MTLTFHLNLLYYCQHARVNACRHFHNITRDHPMDSQNCTKKIVPSDVITDPSFDNSPFQNSTVEQVVRNIVLLSQHLSSTTWEPFTWQQYSTMCGVKDNSHYTVIVTLARGGHPLYNDSSLQLESGYLKQSPPSRYCVTEKFLSAIVQFTKENSSVPH